MTYFRSQHHTYGLDPAFSESLYGQPYFPTGYGKPTMPLPRHMTSDTSDHFDSHYFRDYQYHHGNQFTPQRSFHRRNQNQNQQPSQHRPQYSPYTNTGIDQEHDRSSTNLTSTDRILAMLRINREARLKLRDQSNQDDPRPGSAAQEQAPQPKSSHESENGTQAPAEPAPSALTSEHPSALQLHTPTTASSTEPAGAGGETGTGFEETGASPPEPPAGAGNVTGVEKDGAPKAGACETEEPETVRHPQPLRKLCVPKNWRMLVAAAKQRRLSIGTPQVQPPQAPLAPPEPSAPSAPSAPPVQSRGMTGDDATEVDSVTAVDSGEDLVCF